jgi:hypothetical protein
MIRAVRTFPKTYRPLSLGFLKFLTAPKGKANFPKTSLFGNAKDCSTDFDAAQAINDLNKSGNDTSDWRRIQTSDQKHFLIHPEDLPEAQRRDPKLIVLDHQ